ncbi:MAG: hypothetical protein Q9166_002872 [cf. Caloplaca sp. 2 TL-2023]
MVFHDFPTSIPDSDSENAQTQHFVPEGPQKPYENCVKIIPIIKSDGAQEVPRGRYRIPSRLYEAMRAYLDPNLEWGFVMCCVGAWNPEGVEKRIEELESYLESLSGDNDGPDGDSDFEFSDIDIKQEELAERTEARNGPKVIIPPLIDLTSHRKESDQDSNAASDAEINEDKKRRKLPPRKLTLKAKESEQANKRKKLQRNGRAGRKSQRRPIQSAELKATSNDDASPCTSGVSAK